MRHLVSILMVVSMGMMANAVVTTNYISKAREVNLGEVSVPSVIIGELETSQTRQVVTFSPRYVGDTESVASINTFTGTGAVFQAWCSSMTEASGQIELQKSDTRIPMEEGRVYQLEVKSKTFQLGSQYIVHLGERGDFSVAFDGNGGKPSEASRVYAPGNSYGVLPTATREGYSHTGWCTTNGVTVSSDTPVCMGYSTLVAQWGGNITNYVVFNANGGYGTMSTQTFVYGIAQALTPNAFSRTNYVFSGWSNSSTGRVIYANGAVVSNLTTRADGTVELYASWAPSTTNYVVIYNANGGSGSMPTQRFAYGEEKSLSTNCFTRTNFVFRGWSTSAAGNVVYADGAVVSNLTKTVDGTVSLYANWLPDESLVKTQVVNGVLWHFTESGEGAVIENVSEGEYISAIDTNFTGDLSIPQALGDLPVVAIGEKAFYGCSWIAGVEIPPTVTSIGSLAFAECRRLSPGITIPESVESLGSSVFSGCHILKIVRYWGNCPDADENLYEGSSSGLVSGVLVGRSGWPTEEIEETEEASGSDEEDSNASTNSPIHVVTQGVWPEGNNARKVYRLTDVKQYTVALDCNGGILDEGEPKNYFYLPGRMLGDLPEPVYQLKDEDDETEIVFLGWYTSKSGGEKVDSDFVVDHNIQLYAHWQVGQRDVAGWQETFYEESGEYNPNIASVYDGYIYSDVGSNDCQVVGMLQLKVARGRLDTREMDIFSAATATLTMLGRKKLTLKGRIDERGYGTLSSSKMPEELRVTLTEKELSGTLGDYVLSGARNRFSSNAQTDKLLVSTATSRWGGNWTVVLKSTDVEGEGSAFASDCYSALTVAVGNRGKTKITGVLADGTKVSASGDMILGDGCACVPVVAPLYSGKTGGFAFLLWFSTDEEEPLIPWGVSTWDAQRSSNPFSAAFEIVVYGRPGKLEVEGSLGMEGEFLTDEVTIDDALLPDNVPITVSGTKWKLPKADRVKFSREDEAYEVTTDYGNPAGVKLTFSAATGIFKGSFKVYAVTEQGRSKQLTATVNGAVVNGEGYGSASIKKVGSVPVRIVSE